jgi:hypothetical protein
MLTATATEAPTPTLATSQGILETLGRASLAVPAGCKPDDLLITNDGARARWFAGVDRYITVRIIPAPRGGWIVMPLGNVCGGTLSLFTKATTWATAMVATLEADRAGEPTRIPAA